MDDDNPNPTINNNILLEKIGNNQHSMLCIKDMTVDKYVSDDEVVRFSAISENYDHPVFFGKIYRDHYKIRWQTDSSLTLLVEAIHNFLLTLDAVNPADDFNKENELPFSYDFDGLKIIRTDYETDTFFSKSELIQSNFWENPIDYLHHKQIDCLNALCFSTPNAQITFSIKDKDDFLSSELCLISHLDIVKILTRLIEDTHRVIFEAPLFDFLDSALASFKASYLAHFSSDNI